MTTAFLGFVCTHTVNGISSPLTRPLPYRTNNTEALPGTSLSPYWAAGQGTRPHSSSGTSPLGLYPGRAVWMLSGANWGTRYLVSVRAILDCAWGGRGDVWEGAELIIMQCGIMGGNMERDKVRRRGRGCDAWVSPTTPSLHRSFVIAVRNAFSRQMCDRGRREASNELWDNLILTLERNVGLTCGPPTLIAFFFFGLQILNRWARFLEARLA